MKEIVDACLLQELTLKTVLLRLQREDERQMGYNTQTLKEKLRVQHSAG